MPSYPAKPYEVPYDDWFNSSSSKFENNSVNKETKNIYTIHEFFYRQSDVKVGGSDNHMQTHHEKKSSMKIIISSKQNSNGTLLSKSKEKYSYSKIPTKPKSIQKRSFEGISSNTNLPYKKLFNFSTYLLDLKSVFFKIIRRGKRKPN